MSATFSPFFEVARTRPTSSTSRAHSIGQDSPSSQGPSAGRGIRSAESGPLGPTDGVLG